MSALAYKELAKLQCVQDSKKEIPKLQHSIHTVSNLNPLLSIGSLEIWHTPLTLLYSIATWARHYLIVSMI